MDFSSEPSVIILATPQISKVVVKADKKLLKKRKKSVELLPPPPPIVSPKVIKEAKKRNSVVSQPPPPSFLKRLFSGKVSSKKQIPSQSTPALSINETKAPHSPLLFDLSKSLSGFKREYILNSSEKVLEIVMNQLIDDDTTPELTEVEDPPSSDSSSEESGLAVSPESISRTSSFLTLENTFDDLFDVTFSLETLTIQ